VSFVFHGCRSRCARRLLRMWQQSNQNSDEPSEQSFSDSFPNATAKLSVDTGGTDHLATGEQPLSGSSCMHATDIELCPTGCDWLQ